MSTSPKETDLTNILTQQHITENKWAIFDILHFALVGTMIASACALRVFLISVNWPQTNSDEATMGLMALHIAQGKDFPIFFYGQGYMGALQAYLGGALFHIFGASLFTLRLGLVVIFGGTLISIYLLTKMIYNRNFALFVLLLFCSGSSGVISLQIFANGGYAETLFFSIFLFLIITHIVITSGRTGENEKKGKRVLLYGLLGIVAGLATYSDILILPTLLTTGILLWIFASHEIRSRTGLALLGGFFIVLLPMVYYNLTVPFRQGTLMAYIGSSGYSAALKISFFQRIAQAFLITLPDVTGVSPICYVNEPVHPVTTLLALYSGNSLACFIQSASWAAGYTALWVCSFAVTVWSLIRLLKKSQSAQDHSYRIVLMVRAMLLISVLITFALYIFSAPAALNPRSTDRYLLCMIVAMPALLWPLWNGAKGIKSLRVHQRWLQGARKITQCIALMLIFLLFLKGTLDIRSEIPVAQNYAQQEQHLVTFLSQQNITRFYSDYWLCNQLIFQSQEKLLCAALDDHLQPGLNRYKPYYDIVTAHPQPAYVFFAQSAPAQTLEQRLKHTVNIQYHRYMLSPFAVYTTSAFIDSV